LQKYFLKGFSGILPRIMAFFASSGVAALRKNEQRWPEYREKP
jgi:hypothetical protein